MRIQIDGTNTQNKGAELMAYTIIEQIEKKYPNSSILLNLYGKDFNYGECKPKLIQPSRLRHFRYPRAILYRLRLPYKYFTDYYPTKNVNLLLDASGFKFGDQWKYSDKYLNNLEDYYKNLKKSGSKIILLPQAFGPFTSDSSKRSLDILNKYVDIFFAREALSHKYLIESGISTTRIYEYPDFTITAKGYIPKKYARLKGHVCLIPNSKMLSHSKINFDNYFQLFYQVVKKSSKYGTKAFLLNHEGEDDYRLCQMINEKLESKIPIVSQLNALEVKGVIGNSHMVISSRFHGVSSALNQAVPCLATSWSHKYKYLFQEFGLTDNILDVSKNINFDDERINQVLNPESNTKLREYLFSQKESLCEKIKNMWEIIWKNAN